MKASTGVAIIILAWQVASASAAEPGSAPAPTMTMGDRWIYRVTDREGARIATVSEETREVTSVGPDGIAIRITRSGGAGAGSRTEVLSAPGMVRTGSACVEDTRTFTPPMQRYAFPLEAGKRWNQWIDYVAESDGRKGRFNHFVRVRGWDKLASVGGSVDAIRLDVIVRLDDADAFRNATECNFSFWYAPSVRGSIREQRKAGYLGKGVSPAPMRLLDATYELVGFAPGKP